MKAILEQIHSALMNVLCTDEIDVAESVASIYVDVFLTNAEWALHPTYHMVLKASPGTAIFGWVVLFDIPSVADWNKIQRPADLNTTCENKA